ncbi:MAG TPA: ArsA family ATPase [Solirubrobacteraceae bacterium]|nr:ArsA family ATPase [Solirubrobacteraceae bacterium]
MDALLQRRLIFVTGKGGVGKSTVAVALGLVAARRGLRTIVAELSGSDRLQQLFEPASVNGDHPYEEVELVPGLFTISVDPQHAMEEYLRVKTGPVGQALGSTRLFQAFAMATPGMRELLSIGKVWELAQFERRTRDAAPYDLVIVDAPATGHGVGILRTPRTFAEIARVGPIAHQGGQIARTIADRSFTAVVAVSTPEEMPVNETLGLHDLLLEDELDLDTVIVNARYPERFSPAETEELAQVLASGPERPVRAALRAALSQQARCATQAEQQERLAASFADRLVTLPFLFCPEIGPEELELLADHLEAHLP